MARGKTDFCAAHGGGIKCRAENCMKAAADTYSYCKEHLQMMDGTVENLDDIEDDELFSGTIDEEDDVDVSTGIVNVDNGSVGRKRHLVEYDDDVGNRY